MIRAYQPGEADMHNKRFRWALGIEYNGAAFHGWQTQKQQPQTVQAQLEHALGFVANEPVRAVAAGRTDAGVHACEQVIHFDTDAKRTAYAWCMGTNSRLDKHLRVLWAADVGKQFHARYSARRRRYRYLIYRGPVRPAIFADTLTWTHAPLDLPAMRQAAAQLIGEHDFSAFRAAGCQAKSPVKTLDFVRLEEQGPLLVLDLRADAFLYHMVRNIAGTLMLIGRGEAPPTWTRELLALKDRNQAAPTAPAQGLYFVSAEYPAEFALPQVRPGPVFLSQPGLGL